MAITPGTPVTREELSAGCYAYNYELFGKSGYGYVPSLGAGIFFCVIFGILLLAHLTQTIWKRVWWTLVFPIGALSRFSCNVPLCATNTIHYHS